MVILPNDFGIAPGVWGAGGAHQQPLQFNKCREIHVRRAIGHRGANDGIKHPIGNGNNHARRTHDVQKATRRSLRYAPDDDLAAKIRSDASGNGLPTPARHGQNERVMALGRKSWLFAGSDRGGERAAIMLTLIQTAKLNDVDPQAWLADVLARIADHKITDLAALLPWHWAAQMERRKLVA
jgi:IS66 C-terminal element